LLNRTSWIFCGAAFTTAMVVCAVGFRFAALPAEVVAASKVPTPPEKMADMDLGDFGKVDVIELVGYYIENPPAVESAAPTADAAAPKKRFGGC
jgi:hypothetical protein